LGEEMKKTCQVRKKGIYKNPKTEREQFRAGAEKLQF
jgi:hypothetical protein